MLSKASVQAIIQLEVLLKPELVVSLIVKVIVQ